MKRIALKIDVDTLRGTLAGVPVLLAQLARHDARATFFFSLGPDQSGRARGPQSLNRYYDLATRCRGSFLPSSEIGRRGAESMRAVVEAGCEAGLHAWNRAAWETRIGEAENDWVEAQFAAAIRRHAEIFAQPALAHAAAGWRMNRHALRLTQRLRFTYASDCRGSHPFVPVIDGEIVACPQLPTTLPTLDEVLALEPGLSPESAAERIAQMATAIPGDHVFTLRAELEGLRFPEAGERLLATWASAGIRLVPLRDLGAELKVAELPRHVLRFGELPGRPGARLLQGAPYPPGMASGQ